MYRQRKMGEIWSCCVISTGSQQPHRDVSFTSEARNLGPLCQTLCPWMVAALLLMTWVNSTFQQRVISREC